MPGHSRIHLARPLAIWQPWPINSVDYEIWGCVQDRLYRKRVGLHDVDVWRFTHAHTHTDTKFITNPVQIPCLHFCITNWISIWSLSAAERFDLVRTRLVEAVLGLLSGPRYVRSSPLNGNRMEEASNWSRGVEDVIGGWAMERHGTLS